MPAGKARYNIEEVKGSIRFTFLTCLSEKVDKHAINKKCQKLVQIYFHY